MARQQKKKRKAPAAPQTLPRLLAEQWEEADRLQELGRLDEARGILEELRRRYPNRIEVLASLAMVHLKRQDNVAYLDVCEEVAKLRPNDPQVRLGLIGAYAQNERSALILREMKEFLRRWPEHEKAAEMREQVAVAEPELMAELEREGMGGEEAFADAILHEETQVAVAAGRFTQALQKIEKLIRARPQFAPAYNNASLCHWMAGNLEAAIGMAQRVLDLDPNNIHAIANLCRYLLLAGRSEEAQEMGRRLRAVDAPAWEVWSKKAEAFSYLGDDEGVLEAFRTAEREGGDYNEVSQALLAHLTGVACMRLGQVEEAQRHWEEARRLWPSMGLPKDNLEDSRHPVGERHGGWAFDLPYWLHPNVMRDLARRIGPAVNSEREGALDQAISRFARDHPEVVALVPHLLDRGDPHGRVLAVQIARSLKTPELLEALREFALGQRGPDALRMEVAQMVSAAGLLPPGTIRFWSQGEWRDVMLMGIEIHSETEEGHSPKVVKLLEDAQFQLRHGDPRQAEWLLQQALAIEPGNRSLKQTLAAAYVHLGREAEAEALAEELHREDPDYLFARTLLAQILIPRGELERAKKLVEPLLSLKRLHVSEFTALCSVQIQLLLAEGDRDSARTWLQMWEGTLPNDPGLAYWRQELERPPRVHRLFGGR